MEKNKKYLRDFWEVVSLVGAKGYLDWLPDAPFLRLMFYAKFKRRLNLENPKAYNEKIQWLKLYDRNPLYTTLVDKYKVREYVKQKIGDRYLIPLLGCWSNPDDIDFESLPDRYVLKCNHDSGTVIICTDKTKLDVSETKKILKEKLKRNFYRGGREWPYKNVQPMVICEEYMEDASGFGLTDYKIYCFRGVPKLIMIATDRYTGKQTHFDYFDKDYNWLDMTWGNPRSENPPRKPESFNEMMKIAKQLSEDLTQIRVDLYEVNGRLYFGELTLFDGSGFDRIEPEEWDYTIGEWIRLPQRGR